MKSNTKRYVFITYNDLKKVKFKKLERVCARVYVLIDSKEKNIPFSLVKQTQNIGKKLKWVSVDSMKKDLTYHITFLMGQLHQKLEKEIEFAILSNDPTFDPLVDFINHGGRSCIRVKRKKTKAEKQADGDTHSKKERNSIIDTPQKEYMEEPQELEELEEAAVEKREVEEIQKTSIPPIYFGEEYSRDFSEEELLDNDPKEIPEKILEEPTDKALEDALENAFETFIEKEEEEVHTFSSLEKALTGTMVDNGKITEKTLIEETARETVKRLIRSGNRPSDVSLLKSYILLHNQELTVQSNIDKIIHRLKETKEIYVENQEVVYNF